MNPGGGGGGENFSTEGNSRRTPAAGDGSSIEQPAKRPRGRPAGSKNKLKPPIIITCDSDPGGGSAFRTHLLEIPSGLDVSQCLSAFARRRSLCLCVLSASGTISAATIRHNSSSALTFRGRFDLVSLSATFLIDGGGGGTMSASLAGPQGQVIGGAVVGPLVAAGKVIVVAAVFSDPVFHRLPEEEGEASGSMTPDGDAGEFGDDCVCAPAIRRPGY